MEKETPYAPTGFRKGKEYEILLIYDASLRTLMNTKKSRYMFQLLQKGL